VSGSNKDLGKTPEKGRKKSVRRGDLGSAGSNGVSGLGAYSIERRTFDANNNNESIKAHNNMY
jgi:hypothetical protein